MARSSIPFSHQYLKSILDYDPTSGQMVWRQDRRGKNGMIRAGQSAGCVRAGYVFIGIDRSNYSRAALAWFWMTKDWPIKTVDHISGDRVDDRWENLRLASRTENNRNKAVRSDNKSGVTGVSWDSNRKKWAARIKHDDKYHALGRYDCIAAAIIARQQAEIELFGEFSPLVCRSE
jgi:hypothetical protein